MSVAWKERGFVGAAKKLDQLDVPLLARELRVGEDELYAFMDTETRGHGFDAKGRPIILFEPHVFYRNLTGPVRDRAVAAGLAYPKWGQAPYPKDSYPRLLKALDIDTSAALKATSWGFSQILGENYKNAGYASVEQMVLSFMADEESHVRAMVRFIMATGIDVELRKLAALTRKTTARDCIPVVEKYNGKGYQKNDYHTKFAENHNKRRAKPDVVIPADAKLDPPFENPPLKAVEIRALQSHLARLGYTEVGNPDGVPGSRTAGAILAFEKDNGLPLRGEATFEVLTAVEWAQPRPVFVERATATKETVATVPTAMPALEVSDTLHKVGVGILTTSGVGGFLNGTGDIQKMVDSANKLKALSDALLSLSPWLLAAAGGVAAIYLGKRIVKWVVGEYREGRIL